MMIMIMKIMRKIKIIIIKIIKRKKKTKTTNKTLIYNRQNTYRGREREKKILIYYIQTMKRLPCLICSVNITFIKTKRGKCF